jgi:putative DNA primase/helicase
VRHRPGGAKPQHAGGAIRHSPGHSRDPFDWEASSDNCPVQPLTLSNVSARPLRWLWPRRIPLGKLTILDGDSGLGKSALLLDLAARLTTARPLPDEPPPPPRRRRDEKTESRDPPSSVLLLPAEDALADTVRPRLEAAGADLDRVVALPYLPLDGHGAMFQLPDHAQHLFTLVPGDCRLLVIDPLVAYLAPGVRAHSPHAFRRILAPLCLLADRLDVAVVVVRHATARLAGGRLLHRPDRTTALAAARAGLLIAADPDDPGGHRRLLLTTKANLDPTPPALAYHLETAPNGAPIVAWDGPCAGPGYLPKLRPMPDLSPFVAAVELLEDALVDGPVPADDILRRADREGVSRGTLRRAKSWLYIRSSKLGPNDPQGPGWLWDLSEQTRAARSKHSDDYDDDDHDDGDWLPSLPPPDFGDGAGR